MKKPTGKKPIKYTDEPMVMGEIVTDFLPPPHLLVMKDDSVKVTLALSRRSLEFFKKEASKNKVPYQRMIRALIDRYAEAVNDGSPVLRRRRNPEAQAAEQAEEGPA